MQNKDRQRQCYSSNQITSPTSTNNNNNSTKSVPFELLDVECDPELALLSLVLSIEECEPLDELLPLLLPLFPILLLLLLGASVTSTAMVPESVTDLPPFVNVPSPFT